jgi:hypothetical protein
VEKEDIGRREEGSEEREERLESVREQRDRNNEE